MLVSRMTMFETGLIHFGSAVKTPLYSPFTRGKYKGDQDDKTPPFNFPLKRENKGGVRDTRE